MSLSAEEILNKFGEKCKELGGVPSIVIGAGWCHGLPSVEKAVELRNFTGELLKAAPERIELLLEIRAPHEDRIYTEFIIIKGKGRIYDELSYERSLRGIPGDALDYVDRIREVSSIIPEYEKYRNVEDIIAEEVEKGISKYTGSLIEEVVKDTRFEKYYFSKWCGPWDVKIRSTPMFYSSPDKFMEAGDSIKKLIKNFDRRVDDIINVKDKIIRRTVEDLKKKVGIIGKVSDRVLLVD